MYLFTRAPGQYADTLVISAHGGIELRLQPKFTISSGTLHFYSHHGETTDDLGIRNFIHGGKASQRVESLSAGDACYDYYLSKYQGRHGNPDETYESIEAAQRYVDEHNAMLRAAGDRAPKDAVSATPFDVLTIRNRLWSQNVQLSTALKEVQKVHAYRDIHCYFCRSLITDLLTFISG